MQHFIIDCSEKLLAIKMPKELTQQVYNAADETGLFGQDGQIRNEIKSKKK